MDEIGQIIEPQPVAFSFESPGWTYLMWLIVCVLMLVLLWWGVRYYQNRFRRQAAMDIAQAETIYRVNVILKSMALRTFEREDVASLSGKKWIDFLCQAVDNRQFDQGQLLKVLERSWQSTTSDDRDLETYKQFSTHWISHV